MFRAAGVALGMLLLLPALRAGAIDANRLHEHLAYLSHDRLQGRGAGSQGLVAAGSYIAARFAEIGLEPGGDDGTWFQGFDVTTGVVPRGTNTLRVGERDLALDTDWRPYGYSEAGTVSGELVFAGYGIRASEYDYDDYAGVDVKGKIVLVLALEPGQKDSTSAFEGTSLTPHSDLRTKAIDAREAGAAGMLVVIGPESDEEDRLLPLRPDVGYYSTGILCGQVRRAALEAALPDLDLASWQAQIDRTGKPLGRAPAVGSVAWTVSLEKQRTRLRNVVGVLRGSDPHTALVIGAHYDHLGMGGPGSLDPDAHAPHNGADDNASGTSALIEIARDLASRRPAPAGTLVFVAFSGEEIGLAGSAHYVRHPTIPLEVTRAMLNMDMIGRLRDDRLMVFGVETAKEFRGMLEELNQAGPQFELKLKGDGYGPSDQMSFFKKNVPVLHFFTGAHSDYHKPSDDLETLNEPGIVRVATFVEAVAERLLGMPLTFVQASSAPQPDRSSTGVSSFRSYLGTIPDYAQPEDIVGVLLSGVRDGGPAAQAGLQGGDVIVRIDDTEIRNIYDYVHVLRTRKPDEHIVITVLRDGERLELPAVLGKR